MTFSKSARLWGLAGLGALTVVVLVAFIDTAVEANHRKSSTLYQVIMNIAGQDRHGCIDTKTGTASGFTRFGQLLGDGGDIELEGGTLTWAAMSAHKDDWVQLHFQDAEGDSYETDNIDVTGKNPPKPGPEASFTLTLDAPQPVEVFKSQPQGRKHKISIGQITVGVIDLEPFPDCDPSAP